jgi:hypothetical protein
VLYTNWSARNSRPCVYVQGDKEAARKIFERWRVRFGHSDANEEIYLGIVRHLPQQNPHHYLMLITSKHPDADERDPSQLIVTAIRSMTMTPDSATNIAYPVFTHTPKM